MELTQENVAAVAAKLVGEHGPKQMLVLIREKIARLEREHKDRIIRIERERVVATTLLGSLQAWRDIEVTMAKAIEEWGLDQLAVVGTGASEEVVVEQVVKVDPVLQAHMDGGKCMFKSRKTGKLCQRKLRGKESKERGYCALHWDQLDKGTSEN